MSYHLLGSCTSLRRMCTGLRRVQVMGMMQGKVQGDTFVVVDTFALPVEGTETRVNAAEGAYPYMISYVEAAKVCAPQRCPHSRCNGHLRSCTPTNAASVLR